MFAMNLVDVVDSKTNYGILFCENDSISVEKIQRCVSEIKEEFVREDIDWIVEDIIDKIPKEWCCTLQCNSKRVIV